MDLPQTVSEKNFGTDSMQHRFPMAPVSKIYFLTVATLINLSQKKGSDHFPFSTLNHEWMSLSLTEILLAQASF
ncbi:hypothetical protein AWQ22_00210 [Picosynechococcus sp. PCC 7117]|nr:hypothetical protein AWQ22_00210 [Picosynechococcus sp. PCC 7117]